MKRNMPKDHVLAKPHRSLKAVTMLDEETRNHWHILDAKGKASCGALLCIYLGVKEKCRRVQGQEHLCMRSTSLIELRTYVSHRASEDSQHKSVACFRGSTAWIILP